MKNSIAEFGKLLNLFNQTIQLSIFFFTNADEYINKLVLRFFTIIDDK